MRTLIDEIIVRVENNALDLVIRWHGGDHSALKVKKNRTGQYRWSVEGETIDLVRVLARQMPDKAIAALATAVALAGVRGLVWVPSPRRRAMGRPVPQRVGRPGAALAVFFGVSSISGEFLPDSIPMLAHQPRRFDMLT